jgi:hypothetical protein
LIAQAAIQIAQNGRVEELLEDEIVQWMEDRSAPSRRPALLATCDRFVPSLRARGEFEAEGIGLTDLTLGHRNFDREPVNLFRDGAVKRRDLAEHCR